MNGKVNRCLIRDSNMIVGVGSFDLQDTGNVAAISF